MSRKERTATVIGIDEAGYGPNLGPLVVAATCFRVPIDLARQSWWSLFDPDIIGKAGSDAIFRVDDSKSLLKSKAEIVNLERTLRSFCHYSNQWEDSLPGFLDRVNDRGQTELIAEPWWDQKNANQYDRPFGDDLYVDPKAVQTLKNECSTQNVECIGLYCQPIFASRFNSLLDTGLNKSQVEQQVILELVDSIPKNNDDTWIVVDRLGGRKNYRVLVESIANDSFPTTVCELPDRSEYLFETVDDCDSRTTHVLFEVKADRNTFAVALASMLAKFIRQRCMQVFNRFWQEQIPDLHPTEGYPQDAKRFWKEIQAKCKELKIDKESMWRKK